MKDILSAMFRRRITEPLIHDDEEIEILGSGLKEAVYGLLGRSIAIRELDSGSDNATEIELVNLTTPYYDVERFGISFVASPRHADMLIITGAVTHNMEIAVLKTYEAMPHPKLVVAVGDDACDGGIWKGTYGVNGGADTILPVHLKISGNPPTPRDILQGLLGLIQVIRKKP